MKNFFSGEQARGDPELRWVTAHGGVSCTRLGGTLPVLDCLVPRWRTELLSDERFGESLGRLARRTCAA
jgi:hypothetical protein